MYNFPRESFPAPLNGNNAKVPIPDLDPGKLNQNKMIYIVLSRDDDKNLYNLGATMSVLILFQTWIQYLGIKVYII